MPQGDIAEPSTTILQTPPTMALRMMRPRADDHVLFPVAWPVMIANVFPSRRSMLIPRGTLSRLSPRGSNRPFPQR